MDQNAFNERRQKEIKFFAIYMPSTDNFQMEMMILCKDERSNITTQYFPFKENKLNTTLPGFEDLKLFSLSLPIYEVKKPKKTVRYLDESMQQIENYKIRVKQGSTQYFEPNQDPRKLTGDENIFIFNLIITKNDDFFSMPLNGKSVSGLLEQILCFSVAIAETNNYPALEAFIEQYEEKFKEFGLSQDQQFQKFHTSLEKLLEKKIMISKEMNIDLLHTIVCAFGLFPEKDISMLSSQNSKLDIMLQGLQNYLKKLLQGDQPQIEKKFIKGLSLLFVIEEHTRKTSNWIKLLQSLKSDSEMYDKLSLLVKVFLDRGCSLKIRIRMQNFRELQDIVEDLLLTHTQSLILAPSLPDFVKLAKEYFFLRRRSLEVIEGHEERLRNQEYVLNDSFQQLSELFEKYMSTSREPNKEFSLEMIAEFLRELPQDPDYLMQIFINHMSFCGNLTRRIENAKYPDEKSLELLHEILIKYYNRFLLFKVNKFKILKRVLNSAGGQPFQRLLNFHVKFFEFFMTNGTLNFDEFKEMLDSFFRNFSNTDPLLVELDRLYTLFQENDHSVKQKDYFVTEIDKNLSQKAFDEKMKLILRNVRNPQVLTYFKNSIIQDIRTNSLKYLSTKTYSNPLIKLQNLFYYFPQHALVQELIDFCIAQIPQLERDQVLIQLLQHPHESTLMHMILTHSVFQNTKLYDGLNNMCCSIIEDIQKLDLELKWILYSKRAPTAIMYKQFNIIIDKNNIMQKDSPDQKLDIKSSLNNYYRIWEEKSNAIKALQDFIHKFCSNAIDAPQYLKNIKQIWENHHEKKLYDIISPIELDTFLPFMEKLQPFSNSESFATFRKKRVDNDQVLTCKGEAQKAESSLADFKVNLLRLINDPETTFNTISGFFLDVQDFKTEKQILSSLINEEKRQYFFRVLQILQDQGSLKRICRSLSVCINVFHLSCNFEDTIKTGCKLGLNDRIQLFSDIDEIIKRSLAPLNKESFYEIIQEVETSQNLLEFTIAITQSSEIDFMIEAVNDYDESRIPTQIIFDFVNFWTVISTLKIRAYGKPLEVFIDEMSLECERKSDFCANLQSSKLNFYGIQAIHSDLDNKDKFKKNQIFKIMRKSVVKIVYEQKKFDVVVNFQTEFEHKTFTQTFKSSDILELRDRALLIIFMEQNKLNNAEDQRYKSEECQQFQDFCNFADIIDQVIQLLMKLKTHGFPDLTSFQDDCHVPNLRANYVCNEAKFPSLESLKFLLSDTFDEWKDLVVESYKKYYALTYLKGKDFWKIEKTLINWDSDLIAQIKSFQKGVLLLEYIGKKGARVNLNIRETPQKRLISIGEALIKLEDIPQENHSVNLTENYTFYLVEVDEKSLIRGLLSVYSGDIPSSSQVLFCNGSTAWSELAAFGFRCFYSSKANLFCLVQPEILSFSLRDQFLKLLRDLKNNHPDRKYKLAFVTANMTGTLDNALETKSKVKIFKNTELLDDSELKRILMSSATNCTVVTSRITGLGKSYWIKSQIRSPQEKLVKIPISGPIDPHELGKRLLNYSTQRNLVLWFTIGSIKESDKSLLNNILFSLVVMKSFHDSRNHMRIPKDSRIFIELDSSGFENLKTDIEILRNTRNKHFEFMSWNDLNFTSKKIQFVCYYLLALEDESLGNRDLKEEDLEKKKISKKDCEDMLKIYLVVRRNPAERDYMSYTQLNIYVEILYFLIKAFSENDLFLYAVSQNFKMSGYYSRFRRWISSFTSSNSGQLENEVIIKMRSYLVKTFTIVARYFATKSVQSVRDSQMRFANVSENSKIQKSLVFSHDSIISWDNFNPFIVIFTSEKVPIFIYKDLDCIPESVTEAIQSHLVPKQWVDNLFIDYKNCTQTDLFERLVSLTNKIDSSNVCLKCMRKYNRQLTFCDLCKVDLLQNNGDNLQEFINQIATESSKDYVLTPDNFLKMILIYMRVKQKIPVIIMGETGCGKTSLIRYLSTRILDCEFRPFQIHAGTNNQKVIAEMNKFKKDAEDAKEAGKDLWVFFDEFNTTDSVGLIKEIICERTILGEKLPENMVFLGACNPWKLKTERLLDENIGIHKRHLTSKTNKYSLLYTVNPIPETMVDYIWDYGFLDFESEQKYIRAMLSSIDILKGREKLENFMITLICGAQQSFKKREDVSSVSLRDVSRYKILFEWFSSSLISRNSFEDITARRDQEKLYRDATILAFLHCYYLRIASDNQRSEFLKDFKFIFANVGLEIKDIEFLLDREEVDFVKRMGELPKGIALNQALRENVFALIVCIFTKTPIFICGKPGCSKSLAIQLVFDSFRGKDSIDPYFKTLPELILVAYQGSEYCTSESVLAVFNRAEKYLNVTNKNNKILPVIVFDEIGLAEISGNNPLKILHSKLEVENCGVSFVGISNWRLDASKMNRALYLARPEPKIKELILTGKEICQSFGKNISLQRDVINALAHAYFDFSQTFETNQSEYIFGLRDYYCLVKGIIRDLNLLQGFDSNTLYYVIKNNLRKNFSGLKDEYKTLWKDFCDRMGQPEMVETTPDVSTLELIRSNLYSKDTRYLILITEHDSISEFIEEILTREQAKTVVKLIGSQMPEDLKNESYGYKMLSDIILHLEKGHTLIFKKMNHLYSSLYDLFNQNFAWSGNKRYCRVALGAMHNPRCFVHENLHCIVLMNETELQQADLPFLNRFEKYKVSIGDIISSDENHVFNELEQWVASFTRWKNADNFVKPNMLFVNYSPDYLRTLILDAKKILRHDQENYETRLLELCKQELMQTATFDFPVVVSKNIALVEYLKLYYSDNQNSFKEHSFNAYCEKIFNRRVLNNKSVVYTYTQVSEDISYPTDRPILEFKLSSFRSENEIQEQLRQTYLLKQALLCFRVEFNAGTSHLLFLKNLLSNFANNLEQSQNIHIMIIIHLKRCDICSGNVQIDTLFQGWKSFMFDNLNMGVIAQKEQILQGSFKSLISLNIVPDTYNILKAGVDKCVLEIKYNLGGDEQRKVNTRRNELLERLSNSENLLNLLREKIFEIAREINEESLEFQDWRDYILENEWAKSRVTSSIQAMELGISNYYNECLLRILYVLEQNWLLDSYFKASSNSFLLELWSKKFKEMKIIKDEGSQEQSFCINSIISLEFPFSRYEWEQIQQIQKEAEEFKDRKNPDLLKRIFYDKLKEKSFLQDDLLQILNNSELFKKYMKDQLRLFLVSSKVDLDADIATSILEKMFPNKCEAQLAYFVSHPKELLLIYEALEIILAKENNRVGLYKDLSKTYNLEQNSNDCLYNSVKETLPNRSLLFKDGRYYSLDKEKALKIINNSDLNILALDSSATNQTSFVRLLFENSIERIYYSSSIFKFTTLKDAISGFRLIQAKIKKSGFIPANFELFKPWTDLLQFIEESTHNPNESYEDITSAFKRDSFLSLEIIDELIKYLRTSMRDDLREDEKTSRLLKLQTQFYDNLLSFDSKYFGKVLEKISDNENMWKYSSKIIGMLDLKTEFSKSIKDCNGDIRNLEKSKNLGRFEELLPNISKEIIHMLLNKSVGILYSYYLMKKDFLHKNEKKFTKNLNQYEILHKENPSSDRKDIQFLMLIVWLKVYLHFYVKELLENDQDRKVIKTIKNIDTALSHNWFSTLNLYILKTMKHEYGKSLDDIKIIAMRKNICSFRDIIKQDPSPIKVTPLLPLLDQGYEDPFKKTDEILNRLYSLDDRRTQEFLDLCKEAQSNYIIGICIYSWFIKLYLNYINAKFQVHQEFIVLLKENEAKLVEMLGKTGVKLIFQMLNNFGPDSFLHLQTNLIPREVYQKVTILNVLACFFAQQFTNSTFSSILFAKQDFPENIMDHFSQRCFFGQIKKNKIIDRMKSLKEDIQKKAQIPKDLRFIYKCSPECDYLILFEELGKPRFRSDCPLCKKLIGADLKTGTLAIRSGDVSQQEIKTFDQGLEFIDQKIEEFKKNTKFGYYVHPPEEKNLDDKEENLTPLTTVRFLHFILHATLFGLIESNLIALSEAKSLVTSQYNSSNNPREYFKQHVLQDYKILMNKKGSSDVQVWVYNMILSFRNLVHQKIVLNDEESLLQFEKAFEHDFMRGDSVDGLSQLYNQRYNEYMDSDNKDDIMPDIDEIRTKNLQHYSFLEFFGYLKLPSFEDFKRKFSLSVNENRENPLLRYFLTNQKQISALHSLIVIVGFIRLLIKRWDRQVPRKDAESRTLKDACDTEDLKKLLPGFLKELNSALCILPQSSRHTQSFKDSDILTYFLPSKQNGRIEEGRIIVLMKSLGKIQNRMLYEIEKLNNTELTFEDFMQNEKEHMSLILTAQNDDIIDLQEEKILDDINKSGYIHNFKFGFGSDIAYDFKEIENKLYQYVNRKKLLNTDKFITVHYQFELSQDHEENNATILKIQEKNVQESMNDNGFCQNLISTLQPDQIMNHLGLFDRIFTYLCNVKGDPNQSIECFYKSEKLQNSMALNQKLFENSQLLSVKLKHIIALYELIEETAFKKCLQPYLRPELNQENPRAVNLFMEATINNSTLSLNSMFRNPRVLSQALIKLIMRVAITQKDLEGNIDQYLGRRDLWSSGISEKEFRKLGLSDYIKLKHSYIIYKALDQPPQQPSDNDTDSHNSSGNSSPDSSDSEEGKFEKLIVGD